MNFLAFSFSKLNISIVSSIMDKQYVVLFSFQSFYIPCKTKRGFDGLIYTIPLLVESLVYIAAPSSHYAEVSL